MKINSLAELKREKQMLNSQSDTIVESLKGDVELIKKSLSPLAIISRILPESLIIDKLIRIPLNFIEKKLEHRNQDSAKPDPAAEKKAQIRNIALNIVGKAASVILSRYAARKS